MISRVCRNPETGTNILHVIHQEIQELKKCLSNFLNTLLLTLDYKYGYLV